jgi:hypothetical protein
VAEGSCGVSSIDREDLADGQNAGKMLGKRL